MAQVKFAGRTVNLPRSRLVRMGLGVALVIGGLLGFLPVLGFWMIPLGLIVLSVDIPAVRRLRRRLQVKWGRRWQVWWEQRKARREKEDGERGARKRKGPPG